MEYIINVEKLDQDDISLLTSILAKEKQKGNKVVVYIRNPEFRDLAENYVNFSYNKKIVDNIEAIRKVVNANVIQYTTEIPAIFINDAKDILDLQQKLYNNKSKKGFLVVDRNGVKFNMDIMIYPTNNVVEKGYIESAMIDIECAISEKGYQVLDGGYEIA